MKPPPPPKKGLYKNNSLKLLNSQSTKKFFIGTFSCGEMCLCKNDTSWEDETLLPAKLGEETFVISHSVDGSDQVSQEKNWPYFP